MDKDESESLGNLVKWFYVLLKEIIYVNFKDFSEIIIGFTILANGDLDQRLKWMFNMYDSNRDEFIDYNELKTAVRVNISILRRIFKIIFI